MGYGAALACAFTWSGYSLLTRRFDAVSTDVVTGFCLATAALSFLCHLGLETTVWPETATQWIAVAGLGLLPVGAAFYAWDYGVKNGNIQILGVASYAAPVLSTLVLILFGFAEPSWRIALACLFVTGGAVLAAKDVIFRDRARCRCSPPNRDHAAGGCQSGGAISKAEKSKPGDTVQPTRVHAPSEVADCHQSAGTIACGRSPTRISGPSVSVVAGLPSSAMLSASGAPA